MGLAPSSSLDQFEPPSEKHEATLYYFSGRGLADQIRWMLAANEISFTQKIINQRSQLLKMSTRQLPFGQLPLLQIDGIEIVQSQAAVRYLAKRGNLLGTNDEEILKCDMITEAVRDLISLVAQAPFKRVSARRKLQQRSVPQSNGVSSSEINSDLSLPTPPSNPPAVVSSEKQNGSVSIDVWEQHLKLLKEKWQFMGQRFEAIIRANTRATRRKQQQQQQRNSSNSNNESSNSSEGGGEAAKKSSDIVYDPSAQYFLVGEALTYADVLVAHVTTWFVEECGSEIVQDMPFLVHLQNQVISLPGIKQFIKSAHYFSLGDEAYVDQVRSIASDRH